MLSKLRLRFRGYLFSTYPWTHFFKKNSESRILIGPFLHKNSLHCSSIKVQSYNISKTKPLNVRGQLLEAPRERGGDRNLNCSSKHLLKENPAPSLVLNGVQKLGTVVELIGSIPLSVFHLWNILDVHSDGDIGWPGHVWQIIPVRRWRNQKKVAFQWLKDEMKIYQTCEE